MCNQMRKKKKTEDNLYSTHREAYKALPRQPFGKSDHNYILLIPVYKQKLKQEVPVNRSILKWSDDADVTLQDCFASTDEYIPGFIQRHRGVYHLSHRLHQ